jgi:CRP/FNR family transcriptional regulator
MPELARIETVVILQSVDFFSGCTAEEILRIAAIAHEKPVAPGEEIFRNGQPADTLYCVVRGEIEVTAGSAATRSIVPPLQTLGLLDVLSGGAHTGTAVARSAALLLAIQAEDFFDLLSNNVEVVKTLFRHLVQYVDRPSSERIR